MNFVQREAATAPIDRLRGSRRFGSSASSDLSVLEPLNLELATSKRARAPEHGEAPLSAAEFERILEYERSLADRGTRLFTLLILRRRLGDRAAFERLARQIRRRIRSTDRIGHLPAERLGVLLPDSGPAAAGVVGAWIDCAAASSGLGIERKNCIYPHVPQSAARREEPAARERRPEPAPQALEDLWPRLSLPLPPWKRAFDIVLSATALLVLLPVFLLLAILIRLDSPGPVIFKQLRAGRGGRPFAFYKFRSMFVDAERQRAQLEALNEQAGPVFKIRKDPRITRVGRLLRRWSLDETPQLWNVLKGDCSLVGPRPPTLDEVAGYERWQRRRLNVTGGITGLWQVSGRSEVGFLEWMRMDMRYIANRGLRQDLVLLVKSVPAVLFGRGAY
jgi:lipopolysaccharide/colanic/teichoic acid biosynthesis glycosyltransferase